MPQITFRISEEQEQKGKQLAIDKGLDDNIHQFSKNLFLSILSGETEVVVMSPDIELVKARYEAKLELIKEQNQELLNRLGKETQQSALNGVDTKQRSVQALIAEAIEKERHATYVKELEEENNELKSDLSDLEREVGELRAIAEQEAKMQRWMETGGKVIESIHKVNPRVAEKLTNGLGGLLGFPTDDTKTLEAASVELSDADKHAMSVGVAIQKSFGDQTPQAIRVLKYYAKHPTELSKFLQTKSVQDYLKTLQST